MTFPSAYTDQVSYMAALVNRANAIEQQNNVIQVTKITEPTQADFVTAWLAKGFSIPIQPGYEFHWWDGTRLRGVYGAIDDGFFVLNVGLLQPNAPAISPIATDEVYLISDAWDGSSYGLVLCPIGQDTKSRTRVIVNGLQPCFSPNAQNITYVNGNHVYTATRLGASPTALTVTGTNQDPNWQGTTIAFRSDRSPHAGTYEIYSMTQAGGSQTRLTTFGGGKISKSPQIAPNGLKIAFISNQSGSNTIWVMDVNGSNQVNLGIAADYVRWAADSSKLYYSARRNIVNNVADYRSSFYYPGTARPVSEFYSCSPTGANIIRLTDYLGFGNPGENPVNQVREYGQPYTEAKVIISDIFTEVLCSGFDVFPDGARFLSVNRQAEASPYDHVTIQTNQLNFAGSTGVVHRLISNDTPYGDIELIDSVEITANGILSWRTEKIANRPELSHLLILYSGKVIGANVYEQLKLIFNDDTAAANYRQLTDIGTGAAQAQVENAGSLGYVGLYAMATNAANATSTGCGYAWIVDYNDPASLKNVLHAGGAPWNYTNPGGSRTLSFGMALWNSIAPITSLTIAPITAAVPFAIGTIISVYGLVGSGRYSQL